MSATNRSKLIAKLHTALKKNYTMPPASPSRPLLEHALYACLLEDCPSELADEGLAKLEQDYFDWNEVRVTTVSELAGVLSSLPDGQKAAGRLKSTLQGIFEEFYSFDLDHLKKENLGKAVAKFEGLPGMTPFVLSYIIQHGLGGHSIPIDYSAMVIMLVTGIASQTEAADGRVPGLERAIPKSKGVEFASLLHQPAVALTMDAKDKEARSLIDSVVKGSSADLDQWLVTKKEAKTRVAKRKAKEREIAEQEAAAEAAAAPVAKVAAGKKKPIRSAAKATSTTNKPKPVKKVAKRAEPAPPAREPVEAKPDSKPAKKTAEPAAKTKPAKSSSASATPKKVAAKKAAKTSTTKASTTKTSTAKTSTTKTSTTKPPASEAPAKKKAAKKASTSSKPAKKTAKSSDAKASRAKSSTAPSASTSGKKATNRKLTKRKPR